MLEPQWRATEKCVKMHWMETLLQKRDMKKHWLWDVKRIIQRKVNRQPKNIKSFIASLMRISGSYARKITLILVETRLNLDYN